MVKHENLADQGVDAGFDHAAGNEDGFAGALDGERLRGRRVVPGEIEALVGGASLFAGQVESLGLGGC